MLSQREEVNMLHEVLAGAVNVLTAVTSILVVFNMLEQAGVPYGGAYPAILLASALTTLAAGARFQLPIVVLPAMGLSGFLSYDLIINQGFSWQTVAFMTALAGSCLLVMSRLGLTSRLWQALPSYLTVAVPGAMGLWLLYRGLLQGKLVIGSPLGVTGPGSLAEPTVYAALIAVVVSMACEQWQIKGSLFWGMLTALLVLLLQGFIALPEQLCMVPDGLLQTVGKLQMDTDRPELLLAFLIMLLVLLIDGMAGEEMLNIGHEESAGVFLNGLGAIICGVCGGGAVSAAEGAALAKGTDGKTGLAAKVSFMILCIALFFGPLMREMADQPGITAAALLFTGARLFGYGWHRAVLDKRYCLLDRSAYGELAAALSTVLLVPLWGNLTAGLGAGMLVYVLWELLAGRGRSLPGLVYVFVCLFLLYLFVFL